MLANSTFRYFSSSPRFKFLKNLFLFVFWAKKTLMTNELLWSYNCRYKKFSSGKEIFQRNLALFRQLFQQNLPGVIWSSNLRYLFTPFKTDNFNFTLLKLQLLNATIDKAFGSKLTLPSLQHPTLLPRPYLPGGVLRTVRIRARHPTPLLPWEEGGRAARAEVGVVPSPSATTFI